VNNTKRYFLLLLLIIVLGSVCYAKYIRISTYSVNVYSTESSHEKGDIVGQVKLGEKYQVIGESNKGYVFALRYKIKLSTSQEGWVPDAFCKLISAEDFNAPTEAASKDASFNDSSFNNLFFGDGLSYGYGYGFGLLAEFRLTKVPLRRISFRIDSQNERALFGIDYLYHPDITDKKSWWDYRGLSLNSVGDLQYYGVILGLQAAWGGYIEASPMVSRKDSRLALRTGIKSDGRILAFIVGFLFSMPYTGIPH
jgi:hypothetical protein